MSSDFFFSVYCRVCTFDRPPPPPFLPNAGATALFGFVLARASSKKAGENGLLEDTCRVAF